MQNSRKLKLLSLRLFFMRIYFLFIYGGSVAPHSALPRYCAVHFDFIFNVLRLCAVNSAHSLRRQPYSVVKADICAARQRFSQTVIIQNP